MGCVQLKCAWNLIRINGVPSKEHVFGLAAGNISISFNAPHISPNEAYGWLATYVFNTRHALIHLYQMTSNKNISTDADKTDTIYVRSNLYR